MITFKALLGFVRGVAFASTSHDKINEFQNRVCYYKTFFGSLSEAFRPVAHMYERAAWL